VVEETHLQLMAMLAETAAYRAYYRRAEAGALVGRL
jgi:hypothetical protein